MIATEAKQCLSKSRQQPDVFGAFFLWDDVAVGLQEHEVWVYVQTSARGRMGASTG